VKEVQFNSIEFLVFFPIVVLLYFALPKKVKQYWLLAASYYFYMCWNVAYILLLLYSTIVTFVSGLALERTKRAKWKEEKRTCIKRGIVAVSVLLNLLVLFYYKYFNFALESLDAFALHINIHMDIPKCIILLPVGISFYIFQALSYTIDVYRDEMYAEKNVLRYALFVSFFLQLVAGPIESSKNLLRQLAEPKEFDYDNVRTGLLTMLWGFFIKLVIADRSAILVNTVYNKYLDYSGFQLVAANVLFAVQIYCDFMGYSTIAKGASRVIGYDLISNFECPYFSQSIKEFWRRWHISLSLWLKNYLYIPLGGSRCSTLKKHFNLMVTFLVSGLWHGANETFVLWGGVHGIYLIIEDVFLPVSKWLDQRFDTQRFSWKFLRAVRTFIFVDIAWVFFRAETVEAAIYIIGKSFDIKNIGLILNKGLFQLGLDERNMTILLMGLSVLIIVSFMKEYGMNVFVWLSDQNLVFRYLVYWSALVLIIFSVDIAGQEFIYFQF
jgi:Predicted membrane protein involved in D-alanine export